MLLTGVGYDNVEGLDDILTNMEGVRHWCKKDGEATSVSIFTNYQGNLPVVQSTVISSILRRLTDHNIEGKFSLSALPLYTESETFVLSAPSQSTQQQSADDDIVAIELSGMEEEEAERVQVRIEGMHCSSCVANIQNSMMSVPGVRSANVSLMGMVGTFAYSPSQLTAEEIVEVGKSMMAVNEIPQVDLSTLA